MADDIIFNPLFHQLETTTQIDNFQLLPLPPITVVAGRAIDQQLRCKYIRLSHIIAIFLNL